METGSPTRLRVCWDLSRRPPWGRGGHASRHSDAQGNCRAFSPQPGLLSLLGAAGEVVMGSLSRQVGSAPAAAGGPGMREGRDASSCCRPLCATPWLYIPRRRASPGCFLQSITCAGSAGEYSRWGKGASCSLLALQRSLIDF